MNVLSILKDDKIESKPISVGMTPVKEFPVEFRYPRMEKLR